MIRARGAGAVMLLAALARPAAAQVAADSGRPSTPPIVHYGKWGAAALFVGLTSLGAIEHNRANSAYDQLNAYCLNIGPCSIGPDGRYTNPAAEARYRDVVHGDRLARAYLIAGQVALAGTAALFIVDLMKDHGTRNIPFHGLLLEPGRQTKLGWRLGF